MLTAEQVHDMTGVPISTLHDWAAKRERGIDAPGPHHIRLSNRHRRWTRRDVEQRIVRLSPTPLDATVVTLCSVRGLSGGRTRCSRCHSITQSTMAG
jgi:hypothetical protein